MNRTEIHVRRPRYNRQEGASADYWRDKAETAIAEYHRRNGTTDYPDRRTFMPGERTQLALEARRLEPVKKEVLGHA